MLLALTMELVHQYFERGVMYASLIGLAAIFLTLLILQLRREGKRLLATFGAVGLLAHLLLAAEAMLNAQKPQGGVDSSSAASQLSSTTLRALSLTDDEDEFSDIDTPESQTDDDDSESLRITRYAPPPVNELDVAWPEAGYHAEDIRLYGTWNLRTNYVAVVPRSVSYFPDLSGATFGIDWPSAFSNAVSRGVFPQDATLNQSFFTAAWYNVDTDNDGIPDADEIFIHHTDPANPDTDGDGLYDGEELDLNCDPRCSDSDGDGLTDLEELVNGLNPREADSNGDGVNDIESIRQGLTGGGCSGGVGTGDAESQMQVVTFPAEEGEDGFYVEGSYNVNVTYPDGENTTPDFAILGISSPGGVTTVDDIQDSCDGPYYKNAFEFTADGVSFVPNKTGWYAFQISADDDATLSVGQGISAVSHWSDQVPGPVVSNVFVKGQPYSIRAEWSSVGGPASLRFDKFGEYTPIERPRLSARFLQKAIIFENAYVDRPGFAYDRSSTYSTLEIDVFGGSLGGSLELEFSGIALKKDESSGSTFGILPNERRTLRLICEGRRENSNGLAIVTFREAETGESLVTTANVSVVRIAIEAMVTPIKNRSVNRHVYGIGERFCVRRFPVDAPLSVEVVGGVSSNTLDRHVVKLNTIGDRFGLSVVMTNGESVCYSPRIAVHKPQGVRAEFWGPKEHKLSVGEAGGVALVHDIYIEPEIVSFGNLKIEEVPCYDAIPPIGYFEHAPTNKFSRTHTRFAGAGIWYSVDEETNYVEEDTAGFLGKIYKLDENYQEVDEGGSWCGGGVLEWKVPLGWKPSEDDDALADPIGEFWEDGIQRSELDADGTFTVSKYGTVVSRTIDNKIFINGRRYRND